MTVTFNDGETQILGAINDQLQVLWMALLQEV